MINDLITKEDFIDVVDNLQIFVKQFHEIAEYEELIDIFKNVKIDFDDTCNNKDKAIMSKELMLMNNSFIDELNEDVITKCTEKLSLNFFKQLIVHVVFYALVHVTHCDKEDHSECDNDDLLDKLESFKFTSKFMTKYYNECFEMQLM